jgi:membrane protein YqaA with SNARE-associated domain
MSLVEAYLYLLIDSICGSMILPPNSPYIWAVMLKFEYNKTLIITIATIGSSLGYSFNYLLGILCRSLQMGPSTKNKSIILKLADLYKRKFYWLLLLSFVPVFGEVLTLLSGILRINYWRFLALVTVSRLGFLLVRVYYA